jgi:hypothetical protein
MFNLKLTVARRWGKGVNPDDPDNVYCREQNRPRSSDAPPCRPRREPLCDRLHFFSVFPRKANLRQSKILPIGSMARGEGHQIPGEAIGVSFSLRKLR